MSTTSLVAAARCARSPMSDVRADPPTVMAGPLGQVEGGSKDLPVFCAVCGGKRNGPHGHGLESGDGPTWMQWMSSEVWM